MNELLFNPNRFFNEKLKNYVNLKYPTLIIFINAMFLISSVILLVNNFKNSFPSNLSWAIYIGSLVGAIWCLISLFVTWIILTGIFYFISSIFHSEGSFKRTLEFTGYGFVPTIISSFLSFILLYISLPSINSLQKQQLTTITFSQIVANNPLYSVSQIVEILCIVLSANIWIFALLNARSMSFKNAAFTVCIPVGLYLVYQIYSLIGGLT
jgi:Yip1 domain.